MGLLSNLFGGKKQAAVATVSTECPHSVLVARWESVQDMGIEDKATRFMCETCKEMFTPEEATQLRNTLVQRLARIDSDSAGGAGAGS
jgi:hypothetical protein